MVDSITDGWGKVYHFKAELKKKIKEVRAPKPEVVAKEVKKEEPKPEQKKLCKDGRLPIGKCSVCSRRFFYDGEGEVDKEGITITKCKKHGGVHEPW